MLSSFVSCSIFSTKFLSSLIILLYVIICKIHYFLLSRNLSGVAKPVNGRKIKALLITHAHEDHIGGIPVLVQNVHIPVIYAPKLAASLIKNKIQERENRKELNNLLDEVFG